MPEIEERLLETPTVILIFGGGERGKYSWQDAKRHMLLEMSE